MWQVTVWVGKSQKRHVILDDGVAGGSRRYVLTHFRRSFVPSFSTSFLPSFLSFFDLSILPFFLAFLLAWLLTFEKPTSAELNKM